MKSLEEREAERQKRIEKNRQDSIPILAELHTAGFRINSISDLHNFGLSYHVAIPILISWLQKIENDDIKESLVRCLSIKEGKAAIPLLLQEFKNANDPTGSGLRWAIGNALEVFANKLIMDDLIQLAIEKKYGRARQMVVLGLGKIKDERVVDVLISLLDDPDVFGHAVAALRKQRNVRVRPYLEPFLTHRQTWIRNEAKKAIAYIDKTIEKNKS